MMLVHEVVNAKYCRIVQLFEANQRIQTGSAFPIVDGDFW